MHTVLDQEPGFLDLGFAGSVAEALLAYWLYGRRRDSFRGAVIFDITSDVDVIQRAPGFTNSYAQVLSHPRI